MTRTPRVARRRPAFTIVEAAISSMVLGIVAGAVLTSFSATIAGRQSNSDRSRARWLADELIGELEGLAYTDPSGASTTLGPDAGEVNGQSRLLFDDVDDYHGLVEAPPCNQDGSAMPGLSGWVRQTTVSWIRTDDPRVTAVAETTVKKVRVTVRKSTGKTLATAESICSRAWSGGARGGRNVLSTASDSTLTPK